ncbi:hypothetical protein BD410DRAFT_898551 [Rickenella mellea]|uniref:Uncharacterized protein n=1 Tax=Rickenella mellea TaxID=50990 RepID=A0A4Y7Q560_9AGAM|nr:hypothetical protein BD410DRAFT_898551 [Rickenella mellea]
MDDTRSPPWKVFWERGMELLGIHNYLDALIQFDKAASRKSSEQLIFESRSVALEKLGRYEEALRDSQRVVNLIPASSEGYARSSQILFNAGKLHASLEMVNHALKRANKQQTLKLLCLKKQILNSLRQTEARITSASHFSKLPFEIASTVFVLAAGDQASRAITISHVCKGWRATALKIPALWKSVVISRGLDIRKAGVFLKRANANIAHLEIRSDVGSSLTIFFERHAQDSFWGQLETLALVNVAMSGRPYHLIPWEKLRLTDFILTPKPRLSHMRFGIWEAVDRMAFHTISSVTVAVPLIPSSHLERYKNLTRLQIGSRNFVVQCPQRVLTSLFYNNPGLNTVILDIFVTELTEIQWPTNKAPFAMTSLVHLENHRYGYGDWLSNMLKGAFSFPALRTLHFYEHILGVYLSRFELFAGNLVVLRLSNTGWYNHTAIIPSLLQAAHNLVSLDLFGFQTNMSDEMDALDGHNRSVICPKLEHLHFGSCRKLSGTSLVNLVESRLLRATEYKRVESHSPLAIASTVEHRQSDTCTHDGMGGVTNVMPIQSLVIRDCVFIDPYTIQQLRTMVKCIRYSPSHLFTAKTHQAPKAWR